jgi:ribose transport system substrate-binding protein
MTYHQFGRLLAAAAVAGTGLLGGAAAAGAASDTTVPADSAAPETGPPIEIAYLSASSANTWLQASLAEMEEVAADRNATITEFDAQFDPALQTTQLQDVVASGSYDGIVVAAINGPGIIPDIEEALAAGLQVVVLNQVVGDDLTTADPQVDGVAASVLAPPHRSGQRMGELTVQACAEIDPCRVVYLYGIKGIPLDDALRAGFDEVIGEQDNIEVVAEGEGQYLGPEGGINAIQDILAAQPEFDVVVGADQSIQGVETVLSDEGLLESVALIGLGGSEPAITGVVDGRWFGDVMGAPGDEGRLAMEAVVSAVRDGTMTGGLDPVDDYPDGGLITAENADSFEPQWNG